MANRFFINGGVDNNWSTIGNWSLTSGGTGGEAVPTNADDVFLDGNSPDCVLDTSARVAKTFICTGYVNTLTMTNGLTVSGSVTLASAMTISGSSALTVDATATLTSNTKTWPNALTLTGVAQNCTLADNWTVTGTLTFGGSSNKTINGNNFYCNGSLISNTSGGLGVQGTTVLNLTGTGTWSGSGIQRSNIVINTAGTITLSGTIFYGTQSIIYTAGTVLPGSSTLNTSGLSATLNTNGMAWNNIIFTGTVTIILSSLLSCTGTLTINGSITFAGSAGFTTDTLTNTNTNLTYTLLAGQTYTITNNMTITGGGAATRNKFRSSSAGSYANLILTGAMQSNLFCSATDIDSSGGNKIYGNGGVYSHTLNWALKTAIKIIKFPII